MRTSANGNGHVSKRQEIEALLARGLSPEAIVKKGLSKAYVYQVRAKMGGKGRATMQHVATLAQAPAPMPQNIRLRINVMDGEEVIGQVEATPRNMTRVVRILSGQE